MELSTEIKTHIVTFKGSDNGIYITEAVAKDLSTFRNHPTAVSFPLVDRATGSLIKDIGKYEITSIEVIKKDLKSSDTSKMRWVCDCGRRNYMHIWPAENCECKGDRTDFLQRLQSELILNKNK